MQTSEFETLIIERFGDLSADELSSQMSALISCLDLEPEANELTEAQYQLGVEILDALVEGHGKDYQQAKEWVELQEYQPTENDQENTAAVHAVQVNNDLPAAITNQGLNLFGKIPETFDRQEKKFAAALDQAVLADLNARIANGDLEAAIEAERGKHKEEVRPSFVEMLGLSPASSAPKLPGSSTE